LGNGSSAVTAMLHVDVQVAAGVAFVQRVGRSSSQV
jgi:hypothetical protein